MQGRGEGARVQAAQDQAELVEADRPKARRQDPVLIIDTSGVQVLIDGKAIRVSDGRGLRGIALQCLIADLERDDRPAVK